jgi:outer membrane protein
MKKNGDLNVLLSQLALVIILVAGASASSFASEGSHRVAVVDMGKTMQSIEAGKKARSQLEKEFNAKSLEFQKEEAAIKKMNEDFQKQSLVMNDEARMKKQSELQSRYMKYQQATQQSQEELQKKERSLIQPILVKLREVVAEIAKKKNYDVVLQKDENMVLYFEEKDDLTTEVIASFDKGGKS